MLCMFRNSKEVPVLGVKNVRCAINNRASLALKTYTYTSLIYTDFQTPWLIFCTARERCVLHKSTWAHTAVDALGRARSPAHSRPRAAGLWPAPRVLLLLSAVYLKSWFPISADMVTLLVFAEGAESVDPGMHVHGVRILLSSNTWAKNSSYFKYLSA